MPAVLGPLSSPSRFEDLAQQVAQLEPRLADAVLVVEPPWHDGSQAPAGAVAGLRLRGNIAVLARHQDDASPAAGGNADAGVVAYDRPSGLTLLRAADGVAAVLESWSPRRPEAPRFLLCSDVVGRRVAWRPVYVGGLTSERAPRWRGNVWVAAPHSDLRRGALVFTFDGAWAGMVAEHHGRPAIVPPDVVVALADRMLPTGATEPGSLGITVAPMTSGLVAATGATAGVVVTMVDSAGPAKNALVVTDVIESIGPDRLRSIDDWHAYVGRLAAGDVVEIGGRRRGQPFSVRIAADATPAARAPAWPGFELRRVSGVGSAVVALVPGGVAGRTGLEVGDIITMFDGATAPTPVQIARAAAALPAGRHVVLVVSRRETTTHVLALEKPR